MANQPANKTELAAITLLQSGNFSLEDVYDLLGSRVIWNGWEDHHYTAEAASFAPLQYFLDMLHDLGETKIYVDGLEYGLWRYGNQSAIQDPSSAESWILCVYAGDDSEQ